MKKFIFMIIAALGMSAVSMAQSTKLEEYKQLIKERKETQKLTAKQIDSKKTKEAKKQAKALQKEGWKPAPGSVSLEKQLNDLFIYKNTVEGDMPKYIVGSVNAVGGNYAAARKQALELARLEIANQIEAEVAELTENNIGNKQLNDGEVESITTTMSSSKTLVKQKLGRTTVVFEAVRDLGTKKEVQISIVYDGKAAMSDVMKAFEGKSQELQDKLSEILGLK